MRNRETGFTLFEVIIVVVIVAILSGMSMLALNQAFDRRHQAHADQLLLWLQQLSELAALSGIVYGVMHSGAEEDEPSTADQKLLAVVFFGHRWHVAMSPEPFDLLPKAYLSWMVDTDFDVSIQQSPRIERLDAKGDPLQPILPIIALMPDGYMEPNASLDLMFSGSKDVFGFRWDDELARLEMSRTSP